jgi:hypothetical protein
VLYRHLNKLCRRHAGQDAVDQHLDVQGTAS